MNLLQILSFCSALHYVAGEKSNNQGPDDISVGSTSDPTFDQ